MNQFNILNTFDYNSNKMKYTYFEIKKYLKQRNIPYTESYIIEYWQGWALTCQKVKLKS